MGEHSESIFSQWSTVDDEKLYMRKRFTKVKINLNITIYENFTDMWSDLTLYLTFKKLHLIDFSCSVKSDSLRLPGLQHTKLLFLGISKILDSFKTDKKK